MNNENYYDDVRNFYNSIAFDYELLWNGKSYRVHLIREIANILKRHGVKTAIDLTAGPGFDVILLNKYGIRTDYNDFSPKMVEFFKRMAVDTGSIKIFNVNIVCELDKIPNTYDAVLIRGNSFFHVHPDHRKEVISYIAHNILNENGLIYIDCKDFDSMPNGVNLEVRAKGDKFISFYIYLKQESRIIYNIFLLIFNNDGSVMKSCVYRIPGYVLSEKELEEIFSPLGGSLERIHLNNEREGYKAFIWRKK